MGTEAVVVHRSTAGLFQRIGNAVWEGGSKALPKIFDCDSFIQTGADLRTPNPRRCHLHINKKPHWNSLYGKR